MQVLFLFKSSTLFFWKGIDKLLILCYNKTAKGKKKEVETKEWATQKET